MVETTAELAELCERAREAGRVGLDTEFLWERTYSPQICLAQLNVEDHVYLADPLEGVDLQPVADLISDPDVQVVMHAPHADLVAFAQRHGADPVNTFDTQLAAGFTGLSAGLAYEKLVHEVTRRRVQPSESFTDWSRRPLGEKQLKYAGEDVEHLFAMSDKITEDLRERGREEWMREELSRRFDGADRFVTAPEEAWRKVGRRGKLGPADLAVLREVAAWRERLARTRDLPVGWVAKDPTLIELARRKPRTAKDVSRVRGVDGSMKQRDMQELLDVIERGRDAEPIVEEGAPPIPARWPAPTHRWPMRSACSPTEPISAARSATWRAPAAALPGRSSPRTSSSISARSPRRGSPALTPSSSCCRFSAMRTRRR